MNSRKTDHLFKQQGICLLHLLKKLNKVFAHR